LEHGPLTLYSANQKSSLAIGTIHRHFKQLQESAKIKVYHVDGKRKKVAYGPTVFGFVSFYGDRHVREKLENYFLLWSDKKEFLDDLYGEGFDKQQVSENPREYKKIFANYVKFFNGVEDTIDSIARGESDLPREILIFLSSALLTNDPKYQKIWEDLYANLPALRKSLDEYIYNTVSSYNEFKKRLESRIKN
jgi:hypothetical protein